MNMTTNESARLEKWGVYTFNLPAQPLSIKTGERLLKPHGTEKHGIHHCLCIAADPDNHFAVVIPLSSTTHPDGTEKWDVWKNSWHRLPVEGKSACLQIEQIRNIDRIRCLQFIERITSVHDRQIIESKLRGLLGL